MQLLVFQLRASPVALLLWVEGVWHREAWAWLVDSPVASGAAVVTLAVTGTVWLGSRLVSQSKLEEQKSKMLQMAAEFNF